MLRSIRHRDRNFIVIFMMVVHIIFSVQNMIHRIPIISSSGLLFDGISQDYYPLDGFGPQPVEMNVSKLSDFTNFLESVCPMRRPNYDISFSEDSQKQQINNDSRFQKRHLMDVFSKCVQIECHEVICLDAPSLMVHRLIERKARNISSGNLPILTSPSLDSI